MEILVLKPSEDKHRPITQPPIFKKKKVLFPPEKHMILLLWSLFRPQTLEHDGIVAMVVAPLRY